ncbi:hypothetical protein IMG5_000660 [Ichthyophthirius multifiliis]|uniref:Kelch motif family protein n=1 Tax=Ichthyophthirius multifiliis TaxID=5932 RepID=G0QIV3_ICHMU|nr:hypothetical protein IMG5_000660 [Ichthyophthirius multifiliis]EGR34838.1 hypothetical protein IMG5_000660 [Ichthyophthirius multifiliis]|eukprot:XP_004040142.1 hypothetical protein IMG5_000660 [Ichthyophthirius multifiliis]
MQKTYQIKLCKNCGYTHAGICAANPTDFIWKYGGNNVLQQDHGINVDGTWQYDPNQHTVSDGYNSFNNIIEIIPRNVVHDDSDDSDDDQYNHQDQNLSPQKNQQNQLYLNQNKNSQNLKPKNVIIWTSIDIKDLKVKGSWDNWQGEVSMFQKFNAYKQAYDSVAKIQLYPGRYEYKFYKDGVYTYDHNQKLTRDANYNYNNVIDNNNHICLDDTKLEWKYQEFSHQSWEKMRGQISGHSMNRIGDYVYIWAGYRGQYLDNLWRMNVNTYDADLIDMQSGTIPDERAYHQTVNYGQKILLYGGLNSEKILTDYYVFNTSNLTWDRAELGGQKPSPRERNSMCILKKKALIIFGGYYCSEDFEAEYHYNDLFSLNLQNLKWSELKVQDELPEQRFAHTANIYKHKMYIFGGLQKNMANPAKNFNDVWFIDLEEENQLKWRNLTPQLKGIAPKPRHGHISVLVGKLLLFFGGRGNNKVLFNDTFILDIRLKQWIQPDIKGEPPKPRYYHAACLLDKEIIIFGGNISFGQKQKSRNVYILKFENKIIENEHFDSEQEEQNNDQ